MSFLRSFEHAPANQKKFQKNCKKLKKKRDNKKPSGKELMKNTEDRFEEDLTPDGLDTSHITHFSQKVFFFVFVSSFNVNFIVCSCFVFMLILKDHRIKYAPHHAL